MSKTKVQKEISLLKNIKNFKVLSCQRISRVSKIQFEFKGKVFNQKLKYRNIIPSMISFSLKPTEFKEIENSISIGLDNSILEKRNQDILLFTDDLKTFLEKEMERSNVEKETKFLYHTIMTEYYSLKGKENPEFYEQKKNHLDNLLDISKRLKYKISIIYDERLSVNYKMIVINTKQFKLFYHTKNSLLKFTHDYELKDDEDYSFTKNLIEKIKLIKEAKNGQEKI